jgi:hypothetical protein
MWVGGRFLHAEVIQLLGHVVIEVVSRHVNGRVQDCQVSSVQQPFGAVRCVHPSRVSVG